MKNVVCLVATLALVGTVNAEIQFFFTHSTGAWGLDPAGHPDVGVAADPFEPSSGTGADWYYGYYLRNNGSNIAAPAVPADVMPVVDITQSEFAYLWVHFDSAEVLNDKITRIEDIGFKCNGSFADVRFTTYACDNGGSRWDGCVYPYPELTQNPQKLVAMTAPGILNTNANNWNDMYVGGGVPSKPKYHTALLGAVQCHYFCTMENLCAGVSTSLSGERPFSFLNTVICSPEPVSLMLLGLATLALRRR